MSDSSRSNDSSLRRLIAATLFVVVVAIVGIGIQSLGDLSARREAIGQDSRSNCTGSDDCSAKSLAADIRAAQAAEDVVDLAVWQLIFGAVGIYLVARTLEATRAAVREANDASDAARKAVDVTDDHGRRQLRAYITVELGTLKPMEAGKVPVGAVIVTNSGQTPAFNVSTKLEIELISIDQHFIPISPDGLPRSQLMIGSKFDKSSSKEAGFSLTAQGLQDIKDGKAVMLLHGCTVYEDTFGNTWWTQFAQFYRGPELKGQYHPGLNKGT